MSSREPVRAAGSYPGLVAGDPRSQTPLLGAPAQGPSGDTRSRAAAPCPPPVDGQTRPPPHLPGTTNRGPLPTSWEMPGYGPLLTSREMPGQGPLPTYPQDGLGRAGPATLGDAASSIASAPLVAAGPRRWGRLHQGEVRCRTRVPSPLGVRICVCTTTCRDSPDVCISGAQNTNLGILHLELAWHPETSFPGTV